MEYDYNENYDENKYESEEDDDYNEQEYDKTTEEVYEEKKEQLGKNVDQYIEGVKHNKQQYKYANENLDGYEKDMFLKKSLIDLEELENQIIKLKEKGETTEARLQEMDPNSAAFWILEDELKEQELALRSFMRQGISTVKNEDLAEISDTNTHIIEDGIHPEWRESRLAVKKQLERIPFHKRKPLLEEWYEQGQIDPSIYHYLIMEYL